MRDTGEFQSLREGITRRRVNLGVGTALAGATIGSQPTGAVTERVSSEESSDESNSVEPTEEVVSIEDWYDLADINPDGDTSRTYRLENDLSESSPGYDDVVGSDGENWTPIDFFDLGGFADTFDGNGRKIRDFVVSVGDEDSASFFSFIGDGGEVKDLIFEQNTFKEAEPLLTVFNLGTIHNVEVNVSTSDESESIFSIFNHGLISNCQLDINYDGSGSISGFTNTNDEDGVIEDSIITGSLNGGSAVAGVAETNEGLISGVEVDVQMESTKSGGIVLVNKGTIRDSLVKNYIIGLPDEDEFESGKEASGVAVFNDEAGVVEQCVVDARVETSSRMALPGAVVAGVVAVNEGTVRNCRNQKLVNPGEKLSGGIVAENRKTGEVDGCLKMRGVLSEGGTSGVLIGTNEGSLEASYFEDAPDIRALEAVGEGTDGGERVEAINMAGERAESTLGELDADIWSFPTDPPRYPVLEWETQHEPASKARLFRSFTIAPEYSGDWALLDGATVTITPIDNGFDDVVQATTDDSGEISVDMYPGLVEVSMEEQIDEDWNISEGGTFTVSWEEEVFVRPGDGTSKNVVLEPESECSPPPLGDYENPPQDLDGDGLYEDITGTGEGGTIADVQALFELLEDEDLQENSKCFNFSGTDEGSVSIFDVQALFQR